MAGVKGRSGSKGASNNPAGRTPGSKKRLTVPLRQRIEEFTDEHFDTLIREIRELEVKDRIRAYLDLIKMIVPRPLNAEEAEALTRGNSELVSRLFGSLPEAGEKG